jgi:chitin synthase
MPIEYEAEAWEGGSHDDRKSNYSPSETGSKTRSKGHHNQTRSSSPRSFHPASQSGDFYRDTNIVQSQGSNPNLRNTVHNAPQADRPPTLAGLSQYGGGPSLPQLPFMPFGGGPPSAPGSDYGHGFNMGAANPGMGLMPSYTGSMYGMPGMAPPRNSVMTNLNMYGGGPGSLHGAEDLNTPASMGQQRPMSTFSMATTVNPFLSSTPSQNPDPTDEELLGVLRHYLSTQDLMTVTKK